MSDSFTTRQSASTIAPRIKPLDLLVVPRPYDEIYRKYSTEVFEKGMKPDQTLSPLEANVANTLVEYLEGLQSKDWALPGEDAMFDQKFAVMAGRRVRPGFRWGSSSRATSRSCRCAGLPLEQVLALRKSYRDFEDAERAAPGNVPEAIAVAVIAAARDLGTGLGNYPESAAMARESHFNRFAPFSKAPMAHGFGLVLLLLEFRDHGESAYGGREAGRRALLSGDGRAHDRDRTRAVWLLAQVSRPPAGCPVTNMYETVIWVALATSVMGLALELLWRKKYAALAASGIALLATILAENVSLLDPSIHAVLPVLQSNRWLVGHVLTIVSSYAAFALALGLGLLAVGHYLTATLSPLAVLP